jgi:AAA+ ATPase superfamily predicted ATPase
MTDIFVGRKEEISYLKKIHDSKTAEFVAVYGRRRVGKTYLIRSFFKKTSAFYFEATGLKDGTLAQQLKLFNDNMAAVFYDNLPLKPPKDWLEAFQVLTKAISAVPQTKKIIVFIDEVPWFATPKSGFIQALDYYWNTKWSLFKNMKLIVCGSAASWMLDNLIHAKGGLHNRLTSSFPVRPFTLKETEEYLIKNEIRFTKKQIVELYMSIGGIPHYLSQVPKGLSVPQILNQLCFQKDGFLFNEFSVLFSSLFDSSEVHNEIIRLLAKTREGMSREGLLKKSKLSSSGGMFKTRLSELEEAGFIVSHTPIGNLNKGTYFKIQDEYILFYLKWIEPAAKRLSLSLKNESYFESKMASQGYKAWAGYAFESVCIKHITQIKYALGIHAIASEIGSFRYVSKDDKEPTGCQIDLLIDRADDIINLCEIKFQQGKFIITRSYAAELQQKITTYQLLSKTRKPIFLTMITPEGIHKNANSVNLVVNEVNVDDLFAI